MEANNSRFNWVNCVGVAESVAHQTGCWFLRGFTPTTTLCGGRNGNEAAMEQSSPSTVENHPIGCNFSFLLYRCSTPSGGYVTILSAWPFTAHCVRCANTGSGAIVVERIVPHAPSIEAPTIPFNCKRTREGKLRKTTNTAIKLENVLENLIKLILYYLWD